MTKKPKLSVRLAQNEDGEAIKRLVQTGPEAFAPEGVDLDWTDIYPFWIVAEQGDRIVGALQVIPARPVGRVEMLSVDPELPDRERARVVRLFLDHTLEIMRKSKVQMFTSLVKFGNDRFKRAFKRRGGVGAEQGNIFLMRAF